MGKEHKYFHFILEFSFGLSFFDCSSQMLHCFNMKLLYKTPYLYNVQNENACQKIWDKF
jgi:hypothetical protein